MTESPPRPASTPLRGRVLLRVAVAALAAAFALGPAAAASASLGSVPADVAAYVADGMIARLDNVYGKNASGQGIDFDATTKAGQVSRVYEWTAARSRGAATDHPVQLTNNWVVPITIASKPVGLATIWINPQTADPELASFDPTPALATALAAVPATAALVRDTATHAWLALDSGTVTPLVAGSSGLTTPVPVASLTLVSGASGAAASTEPNTGLTLAIGALALIIVIIVIALLVLRRRPPRAAGAALASAPDPSTTAEPLEPAALESPERLADADAGADADADADAAPVAVAVTPRSSRNAKPASPVTKPTGSKPGDRTSVSAAASTKPPVQKPRVQKPRVQKPPVQKPPVQMPPVQKPAVQKPAATKPPTPRGTSQSKPMPRADPGNETGTDDGTGPDQPRGS
jgi:hypothetical protein